MTNDRYKWWGEQDTHAALASRQQAADNAAARLDPMTNALRMGSDVPAELDGLSADAIQKLSMSSYAEIRRRAGLPELDPFSHAYRDYEPPGRSRTVSAPEAAQANTDMGVPDFASMSLDEYAIYRDQAGIGHGQYGRGALDGGSTADWIAAARSRGIGRTSYGQQNVQDAAKPDATKYLRANEPAAGRANFYR